MGRKVRRLALAYAIVDVVKKIVTVVVMGCVVVSFVVLYTIVS